MTTPAPTARHVQLLVQRVTNGIIVSPVHPSQPGIDLSQIAVFRQADAEMMQYLNERLNETITMTEVASAVRQVRDTLEPAAAPAAPGA